MISRSTFEVFWVVLILFVASGCGKGENQPQSETATYGSFELVADEVLKPVIDSLVQGFTTENPTAKVTVKYVSAGEAVRELMNHQARAIIIDRGFVPQEREVMAKDSVTFPAFRMAEDGIGCITSRQSKQDTERLSDILERIQELSPLVFPEYPSSIEYILDSMAGAKWIQMIRFATTDSIITYIAKNTGALGFVSSAWKHELENKNDSSVKFLPIIPHDLSSQGISEPVMLHIAYIAEKAYPLTTIVNGYTTETANTVPRGFFVYCMTAHGQTVFKNFGLLPKTQPIKLVPAK